MTPALSLENVTLTLPADSGPVEILRGVSLDVARGEILAIVGPSGSGKSSLISLAAGLETATSGQITLLDQNIIGMGEDALAELRRGRVSMVFQSFHLLPTMTAYDNVRIPLEVSRLKNVNTLAKDALDAVGLSERMTHYPGQLSGGERQRVAVARALASSPDIVFADEPTGNLDSVSGDAVAKLLFSIAKDRGATLVMVTHDQDLAKRADRIVTMSDGRIV